MESDLQSAGGDVGSRTDRCHVAHFPAVSLRGLQLSARRAGMEPGVAWCDSGPWQPCIITLNLLFPYFTTAECDSALSMDLEMRKVSSAPAHRVSRSVLSSCRKLRASSISKEAIALFLEVSKFYGEMAGMWCHISFMLNTCQVATPAQCEHKSHIGSHESRRSVG